MNEELKEVEWWTELRKTEICPDCKQKTLWFQDDMPSWIECTARDCGFIVGF